MRGRNSRRTPSRRGRGRREERWAVSIVRRQAGRGTGLRSSSAALDPDEFLARMLMQIPEPRLHVIRYSSAYSSAVRARRREACPPPLPGVFLPLRLLPSTGPDTSLGLHHRHRTPCPLTERFATLPCPKVKAEDRLPSASGPARGRNRFSPDKAGNGGARCAVAAVSGPRKGPGRRQDVQGRRPSSGLTCVSGLSAAEPLSGEPRCYDKKVHQCSERTER